MFLSFVGTWILIKVCRGGTESLCNLIRAFSICIMQTRPSECRENGFDQNEPRRIGGRPADLDTLSDSGRELPKGLLMSTEIVHDKVNIAPGAEGKHALQAEEGATTLGRFRGGAGRRGAC